MIFSDIARDTDIVNNSYAEALTISANLHKVYNDFRSKEITHKIKDLCSKYDDLTHLSKLPGVELTVERVNELL
jgi:hypothetical protein